MPITKLWFRGVTLTLFMCLGSAHAGVVSDSSEDQSAEQQAPSLSPQFIENESRMTFTKDKQLLCWQSGKLIVLENGWMPSTTTTLFSFETQNHQLITYDFGDTFCLYRGVKQP